MHKPKHIDHAQAPPFYGCAIVLRPETDRLQRWSVLFSLLTSLTCSDQCPCLQPSTSRLQVAPYAARRNTASHCRACYRFSSGGTASGGRSRHYHRGCITARSKWATAGLSPTANIVRCTGSQKLAGFLHKQCAISFRRGLSASWDRMRKCPVTPAICHASSPAAMHSRSRCACARGLRRYQG